MIFVDRRVGSKELIPIIRKIGVRVEESDLPFGDACFEGNGPDGTITIGIERKTLHDMLHCIDDARYVGQRLGMQRLYNKSYLMLEGCWKPHEQGFLMEGFNTGTSWGFCRYRSRQTMYSKLRRYLFSMGLGANPPQVIYTRDMFQSAYDICECFHYFQKKWADHTSLLEVHTLAIPELSMRPSLTRRWAAQLKDIGVKYSIEAENLFRKPIKLAQSSESDWLRIPGIGVKTARQIIKEIWG